MANRQKLSSSYYTPISDANAVCDRTCAKLLVYSNDLHPSAVTALLGIEPTSYVAIGEKRAENSIGLAPVGKVNGWFLSSETKVQSKDLRRHLDWLISQLRACSAGLRELQETPGIRMYVNCPWWSRYGGGGPSLWPEQMRALAEFEVECSINFADYSVGENSL